MTVLAYIGIFAAIVAVVAIGGAICENKRAEEKARSFGHGAKNLLERIVAAALMPIEAAFSAYEERAAKTR